MKYLVLIGLLYVPAALAGFDCREPSGGSVHVEVTNSWPMGYAATFSSDVLSKFYQESQGMNIPSWSSVTDPDTNKAVVEISGKTFNFMMKADSSSDDDSEGGAVWGLELVFNRDYTSASGHMVDMGGDGVQFRLACTRTPDLE